MKQLLVLSGKGGTGKTTVASALIELSGCRAFADCDVDAPNLHLTLRQTPEPVKNEYCGLEKAWIDSEKCIHCGLCGQNCRFNAIHQDTVDMLECEGCGVCAELCPAGAVQMAPCSSGDLLLYRSPEHVFSTARLKMGSGASGKLVTEVKRQLGKEVPDAELAIVDGSPGIGCPVIASVSGASLVLIVAEPTLSGFHDLKRILETGKQFGVIIVVCINKFDINTENTKEMERFCHEQGIPIAGKIPFDKTVVEVSKQGKCITCYSESPAGKAIVSLWKYLKFYLT